MYAICTGKNKTDVHVWEQHQQNKHVRKAMDVDVQALVPPGKEKLMEGTHPRGRRGTGWATSFCEEGAVKLVCGECVVWVFANLSQVLTASWSKMGEGHFMVNMTWVSLFQAMSGQTNKQVFMSNVWEEGILTGEL